MMRSKNRQTVLMFLVVGLSMVISLSLYRTLHVHVYVPVESRSASSIIAHDTIPADGHWCNTRLPDVIIAGVPKCGTYALSVYMDMHPEIQLLRTETLYFSKMYKNGLSWYLQQMPCKVTKRFLLERASSVSASEEAMKRIAETFKNVKLIFTVRDPITRLISHYSMNVNILKRQLPPFEDMFLTQNGSLDVRSSLINQSFYFINMQNWLKYFDQSQILIIDGDNLIKNPVQELRRVEQFLGVQQYFDINKQFVLNKEKGFYCMRRANGGSDICFRGKGIKHVDVSKNVLRKLYSAFQPENEKFFKLINKTFNWTFTD